MIFGCDEVSRSHNWNDLDEIRKLRDAEAAGDGDYDEDAGQRARDVLNVIGGRNYSG